MSSVTRRSWLLSGTAAVVAVLASLVLPATGIGVAAAAETPLRIGIIGTGNIGGTLATHWARAGHELVISGLDAAALRPLAAKLGPKVRVGTPAEAAAFGSVVLVSVPYRALPDVGREHAAALAGKVVIDTGNPYPQRDGAMAEAARREGTGVASARYLPGTRLVRAFNATLRDQANRPGGRLAIPVAADELAALEVANRLVRDAGFDPVVTGGLDTARRFDVDTAVYVKPMTADELRAALGLR